MAYRFQAQETIPTGIKRIANEQIELSIYRLTDELEVDRTEAIHSARKHFKKLRALVRLVRDQVGQAAYKRENRCFRDAGRELSALRDAEVRIETLDALIEHYQDAIVPDQFQGIRQVLVAGYNATQKSEGPTDQEIGTIVADLNAAQARIQAWTIPDQWQALQGGLHRVYQRGYKAFLRAWDPPTAERLHEWRKRVKYLWYHLRILAPIWPETLAVMKQQAKALSDLLGDDHDLAVLRAFIVAAPAAFTDDEQLGLLLALIQLRQLELQNQAYFLGQRLYAEKPQAFCDRMAVYWQAWQVETAQPPVQEFYPLYRQD